MCSPIHPFIEKVSNQISGTCSEIESIEKRYEMQISNLTRELDFHKSNITDVFDFKKKYSTIQEQCIIQKEKFQATIEYLNEKHEEELNQVKFDCDKEMIELETELQAQKDYSEQLKEQTTLIYENIIQNLTEQLVRNFLLIKIEKSKNQF